MYEIAIEQFFESAHFLRGYRGKCENIHGHRYTVKIKLKTNKLNEIGLAYDFVDLKRHLKSIIEKYDHASLNDISPFDKINPSAENIATTIHAELKPKLSNEPVEIMAVEIWENPHQGIIYNPD